MKKLNWLIIFTVLLIAATSYVVVAFSASGGTPAYGPHYYGQENILFRGDLSQSGLGVNDERPSIAHWHRVRFKRTDTREQTDWINAVQYDIQPTLPTDDFSRKSGYLVLPVEERTIKWIATLANGNPDYIWDIVKNKKRADIPYYTVDGLPFVDFGKIIYLSGGGDPEQHRCPEEC